MTNKIIEQLIHILIVYPIYSPDNCITTERDLLFSDNHFIMVGLDCCNLIPVNTKLMDVKKTQVLPERLKRWLPTPDQILHNKALKLFAPHLVDPRLWHFNRRSLIKAVYIGVMSAFFPLPGQMPIAIAGCLYFRANVPMAVALTWITNPVTTIPIFYVAYWVGTEFLDTPMISFQLIGEMLSALSLWIFSDGSNPFIMYQDSISLTTFLLGLTVMAVVFSIICGIAFSMAWRIKTSLRWNSRHQE